MGETADPVKSSQVANEGSLESARLNLQHWMWGQNLGYQLHPRIPRFKNIRVADVGAGNGLWLLDIARTFGPDSLFVGLDISPTQLVPKQDLPANVELRVHDVYDDIPEDLVGIFHVVHLRTLAAIIPGGNPTLLLEKLLKLLRPGGYLQWDEADVGSLTARAPDKSVSKENTEEVLERWHKLAVDTGQEASWVSKIPGILHTQKLRVLHSKRYPTSQELYKASTDDFAVAIEDTVRSYMTEETSILGTDQEWEMLFEAMLVELGRGVSITTDMIVCLGQKGTSG